MVKAEKLNLKKLKKNMLKALNLQLNLYQILAMN